MNQLPLNMQPQIMTQLTNGHTTALPPMTPVPIPTIPAAASGPTHIVLAPAPAKKEAPMRIDTDRKDLLDLMDEVIDTLPAEPTPFEQALKLVDTMSLRDARALYARLGMIFGGK